jgi:hypothetical protein
MCIAAIPLMGRCDGQERKWAKEKEEKRKTRGPSKNAYRDPQTPAAVLPFFLLLPSSLCVSRGGG